MTENNANIEVLMFKIKTLEESLARLEIRVSKNKEVADAEIRISSEKVLGLQTKVSMFTFVALTIVTGAIQYLTTRG